ncbi:heme-binding protein [Chromatocurvus halotolerans]|uniref:Heme-degrading protein n=1 Tax=Chromatocurvus halotolerans TaxID=1132028 RepID=A0A4R2KDT6_9GAMM|nr:heme-binding protein [Chromatocurvus halotolerans]TCO71761.1 heme-degrading protein [Chromatocurvus halotolerans]
MLRMPAMALLLLAVGCGGGSGGIPEPAPEAAAPAPQTVSCDGQCADSATGLSAADVRRVLAQGIAQAQAVGARATLAVVDRVGNVLAVHRMGPQGAAVTIATDQPVSIDGGLEGLVLPAGTAGDAVAAIAKAVTGAFLSSEGNAFSTRTANQIVQEHFNPGELNQPSGPLFGVQFSQLACSDFTLAGNPDALAVGPQRSPLGLAADPGGFPLYKDGTPVGGVGVMADGLYGIDRNLLDRDDNLDERIALAATFGFAAPADRRADVITVEGKTLRFSDLGFADLSVDPQQAPRYDDLADTGSLVAVPGYSAATIRAGTRFGQPASGVVPAVAYADLDAFVFVDAAGDERFPARSGTDAAFLPLAPLQVEEVDQLLRSALTIANRARAQIRRPLGTAARVTVSVVDSRGEILGMLRSRDAPVFGADVSLQKARTATLFSSRDAGDFLKGIAEPARYLSPDLSEKARVAIGDYVEAARLFVGPRALQDGTAFSDRAGGNLSRPFYPDGIRGNPNGPFSKSFVDNEWSVLSTGLQLDLVINRLLGHVLFAVGATVEDVGANCAAAEGVRIANGMQIFPGSVPIYRGNVLVGGIGVSGDGIDQDDMIAFLGVHEAGLALNGALNNAPPALRADQLAPRGERLRYVQCPQSPFNDSDEQQVCAGK